MSAPTAEGLVAYLERTGDPTATDEAILADALAWARKALGREADDDLADLDGDNARAVYGYASDLAKLPRTQFGYFATGDDELATMVGDIGRRWSGMLGFGHRTGVSFA